MSYAELSAERIHGAADNALKRYDEEGVPRNEACARIKRLNELATAALEDQGNSARMMVSAEDFSLIAHAWRRLARAPEV